jgi:hypothetical protein
MPTTYVCCFAVCRIWLLSSLTGRHRILQLADYQTQRVLGEWSAAWLGPAILPKAIGVRGHQQMYTLAESLHWHYHRQAEEESAGQLRTIHGLIYSPYTALHHSGGGGKVAKSSAARLLSWCFRITNTRQHSSSCRGAGARLRIPNRAIVRRITHTAH